MKFSINTNNQLILNDVNKNILNEVVTLKECFPNSIPDRFLSVQNKKGEELFILKELQNIDHISQRVIRNKMDLQGFQFQISKIISIEEEYGIRHWKVETHSGPRVFQTSIQDWPKKEGSKVILTDLNKDIYEVQLNSLDKKSILIIGAYVD